MHGTEIAPGKIIAGEFHALWAGQSSGSCSGRSACAVPTGLEGLLSRGGRISSLDGLCDLQGGLSGREVRGIDNLGLVV